MLSKLYSYCKYILFLILIIIDYTFILGSDIIAVQNEYGLFSKHTTIKIRAFYNMTQLLSEPFKCEDLRWLANMDIIKIIWWKGKYGKMMTTIDCKKELYLEINTRIIDPITLKKYNSVPVPNINIWYGYIVECIKN